MSQDLSHLIDFELRRKTNLIKTLRKKTPRQRSADSDQAEADEANDNFASKNGKMELIDVIIGQLQTLRRKRPHFLLLIDEIDAFSKGEKDQ